MAQLDNIVSFFTTQKEDARLHEQKLGQKPMADLFRSGDIALGYIHSVMPELGLVVLKFYKSRTPRLKVQKELVLIAKDAGATYGADFLSWSCTWDEYKRSSMHSSPTNLMPMHYLPMGDPKYDYVACSGIGYKLYDIMVNSVQAHKSLPVLVYDPPQPIELFGNMINYMVDHRTNPELFLEAKIDYEDWHPQELEYNPAEPDLIWSTIYDTLQSDKVCILQGPPGSGKSYTIAQIVQKYLDEGKSVCATTMANKGLMELVNQEPLHKALESGAIFKTHLSADEHKQAPNLQAIGKDLSVLSGQLLCATNYELSYAFNPERVATNGTPQYDLIVIEEASQALLTCIAAFKSLANHCLIVGDPMQLPPIVTSENNPSFLKWNVSSQIEGLKTFALGSDIKAYRIVTSFRMTQRSADLTKIFYANRFRSVQKEPVLFPEANKQLFPAEGGVLYCVTEDVANQVYSNTADTLISQIIQQFSTVYLNKSLAVVTPFQATVRELQKRFITEDIEGDITIETIDRIQGMTLDYAILYLPARNPDFALTENRFNVATSRSRSTTLIISDVPIENFPRLSPRVINFLKSSVHIDTQGNVIQGAEAQPQPVAQIPEATPEIYEFDKPQIGVKVLGHIDLTQLERPKKEIVKDKKNYYIIDTNVFIKCPDVIRRIDVKYPIILSAKVTDELDKMKIKLDERGKQNAENALRLLNNETSHTIIYEFADTSLLPEDFDKRSPDNMILSVALKYKDENPIMLTSDNGLQLKSKIFGISTISLCNFLKR